MSPDYYMAFAAGVLGGFGHCIGMCGPLVASYSIHGRGFPGLSGYLPHLLYNAGRITTYASIGVVMGLSGSFASTVANIRGAQHFVLLVAGMVMAFMGIAIASGRNPEFIGKTVEESSPVMFRAARAVIDTPSAFRYFPLGLLLGFMPCGLSYSIFIGAAASGGPVQGGAFALSFGLGSAPALILFGLLAGHVGAHARGIIYRFGGMIVAAMGLLYIYRGFAGYAGL
ncbi:MAG: sulfite exporter TauE/SafE family protein [Thermodesulfovibrionales bacterium]|nr:sulfite exporter TauE/SafE family protein [Thermodesulfovibrionales bacterium]